MVNRYDLRANDQGHIILKIYPKALNTLFLMAGVHM